MTGWLRQMLGLSRPEPNPDAEKVRRRSDVVLAKAERVLVEETRLDLMRESFRRAGRRLAR